MIINLIIFAVMGLVSAIFVLLPVVTIASIPVIGQSMSDILGTMVITWNAFIVTFPYAGVAWGFWPWIVGFELLLLLGKFFLGHRMPTNSV